MYRSSSYIPWPRAYRLLPGRVRTASGAVTPFIAMAVILMMGMLGICIDMTRDLETSRQLTFATQSAALYGLSLVTNADGTYSQNTAANNIQTAVSQVGINAWNSAQYGPATNAVTSNPQAGIGLEPVTFAAADLQLVGNSLDAGEQFVQLTARRQGADALQQYFLPLLYTSFNGPPPQSVRTFSTTRLVEVLGQPATRIGAGAPLNSQPGSREAQLAGFASLPLAISYNQFAALTNPGLTNTAYTIDLVLPNTVGTASAAGHIKGCLVNVSGTGTASGASFYNNAQGTAAFNQLLGLFTYFGALSPQPALAPAVVEQGSQIYAFDPTQWSAAQQNSISQALRPNSFRAGLYIIPVLLNDPNFGNAGGVGPNQVIGFAHLNLTGFTITNGLPVSASVLIADSSGSYSVPVRNATSAITASIPVGTVNLFGSLLPSGTSAVPDPFLPRKYDQVANTIAVRPRGIVMAPALSPRILLGF